ncbi:MAG: hypothetical protein MJ016_07320 [Victivallaceae bacterium]|nr:hypothetical protein [Victivallaceae bacterium]
MRRLFISITVFAASLLMTGCSSSQGLFGVKMCAVYHAWDSGAFHLQEALESDVSPDDPARGQFLMFLAVCEMHRGMIMEMHADFDAAEKKGTFPEQFLVRAQWYCRAGMPDRAEKELAKFDAAVKRGVDHDRLLYSRYLMLCTFDRDEWKRLRDDAELYRAMLDKKRDDCMENLQLLRADGEAEAVPAVLRSVPDPAWKQVRFGMTTREVETLIGAPQKEISPRGFQQQLVRIYPRGGRLFGFCFSDKTGRLGDLRMSPDALDDAPEK